MGLDMYLHARRYLSDRALSTPEERKLFQTISSMLDVQKEDLSCGRDSGGFNIMIGYWRKANAIHQWFVDNVQGGQDNCATYYVSHERLKQLREICTKVLDDRDAKLLSPASGFFFGSTDVDEYYFECIQHTIDVINKCLQPKYEGWDFYYQSSW